MKEVKKGNSPSRKRHSYIIKKNAVRKILSGDWSKRQVSLRYDISYATLEYWCKQYATDDQKSHYMGQNKEIERLRERIEILEFMKDVQQDIIVDLEDLTGNREVKKGLPEHLIKEIEQKRKQRGLK